MHYLPLRPGGRTRVSRPNGAIVSGGNGAGKGGYDARNGHEAMPPAPRGAAIARGRRRLCQVPAEALDATTGLFQIFGLRRVGNAKGRSEAEGRALHHRHAFRLQQLRDEIRVVCEFAARGRGLADGAGTGWINIEGTLRHRAFDALRLVEHRHDEVTPLLEDTIVPGDEILRTVERLDR